MLLIIPGERFAGDFQDSVRIKKDKEGAGMYVVVGIALLMIAVGFIRVMVGHEDNPEDSESAEAPDDADGETGGEPEGAMEREAEEGAEPRAVSTPPWADDPQGGDAQWRLRSVEHIGWLGGAPPTLSEYFEKKTETPPEGPVEGWIMPQPDESLMEHPEDYGIDNGDPNQPMWTPPGQESGPEPDPEPETQPEVQSSGGWFFGCGVVRGFCDAMYLLQVVGMLRGVHYGVFTSKFALNVQDLPQALATFSGALLVVNIAMLVLFAIRSEWTKSAFLIYLLLDVCVRAVNIVNGFAVGGSALDRTVIGVAFAILYDVACALYLFRAQKADATE